MDGQEPSLFWEEGGGFQGLGFGASALAGTSARSEKGFEVFEILGFGVQGFVMGDGRSVENVSCWVFVGCAKVPKGQT